MCHVHYPSTPYHQYVASMFDTIADMLRGSAPDDLAHALGTDRTQTRRAMEIGLPALITGLRDKTLEPGGAQNLAAMLDEPSAAIPADLDGYLAAGDPAQGAAMLDVAFGDRGEPALASLSNASGLSTRLLAQVMSVLAPLATGVVGSHAERSPDGLRSYLADAVGDLEAKGFGRVVQLVSPAGLDAAAPAPVMDLEPDPVAADSAEAQYADIAESVDSGLDLDSDANVVEGVFPDSIEDVVEIDEPIISLPDEPSDATMAFDSMPSFDAEVANVVPASVDIIDDADLPAPTMTLADAPDIDPDVEVRSDDLQLEGKGLSGMGWLWWLIGAVLGLVILLFALSQCGGSDGEVATTTDTAVEPTPDPAVIERQNTLDGILAQYPGVQGEVFGDVAVLDGTVANETERALLDQAVRAAGLGVQNNVTAPQAAAPATPEGYAINDLIDAQPELSTLRALLDQAGLGDALSGGGEFTLFAPTNDAFAAISDQVSALQGDPAALQDVLRYHLLVGAEDSASIAINTSIPTQLEGQSISVDASGPTVLLNGSVPVLVADAPARNGVMHIIGGVLLPNVATALPEEIGAELGLAPITFALGSSELTSEGQVELDKVAEFLLATPGAIEIGGHTDSDGDAALNQRLSQERADAVKSYLSGKGVPADSMTAVGFGADQPIAENDTPENKARNRRIEFRPT